MPRRRIALALVISAAACALAIPVLGIAAGGDSLPDLRADPPENPYVEVYSDGRLLLRFDGFVTNVGQGPLDIDGNPQQAVYQRVLRDGALVADHVVPVRYETSDAHDHFHLMNAMRYSLWNGAKTAEVAPGQKVGFCLYDLQRASGVGQADPAYLLDRPGDDFCRYRKPTATTLSMGVSSGWRDVYNAGLAFQWVDVSDTPPGAYFIASQADPNNVIRESDESNNGLGFTPFTLPGYLAQPVTLPQTGSPRTIGLGATTAGSPAGAVRFRVLTAPAHGTLDRAVGETFTASQVTYTPAVGYRGSDTFTYGAVALSSGRAYPIHPPAAAVALVGNAVTVAISGAPAALDAGTGAQLTAGVANGTGGVTWSASAGSISSTGLYVAPSQPPPGGLVTIRATSVDDPSVSATVVLSIRPVAAPVPAPSASAVPAAAGRLLSTLSTGHIGRRTIVGKVVVGARAGTMRFTATFGRTVVGRCIVPTPARRSVTCKITLKRDYNLRKVLLTAQLRFLRSAVVRRAYVARG